MRETLQQLAEETAKAASGALWPLRDDDVVECLLAVHRWEQTLAGLKVRLAREAGARGVPAAGRHRSLSAWLRTSLRIDPAPARDLEAAVTALHRRPRLEQALIDGDIDIRQAQVIAAAVESIPETLAAMGAGPGAGVGAALDAGVGAAVDPGAGAAVDPGAGAGVGAAVNPGVGAAVDPGAGAGVGAEPGSPVDEAEAMLVEMAERFPAYQLRRLGDRILAHVAPEVADRADEAALRRAEQRAHRQRGLTLSLPVDGMVRVSGSLDVESAAVVSAALQPLCAPIPGDDRTAPQRRADALADVCRLALRTAELPTDGGEPPQITVTVPYDEVAAQLKTGTLDNGARLTATTVRRLACDARILPIVLGTAGQVLDAGRARRLATGPLRRALVARDRGCAFPDCDRPARWCDAHHLRPWSRGGATDLDNLVLLCRHHHRMMHDPEHGWTVRLNPDRHPEFVPPSEVDADRRPRRNVYHLRI